MGKFLIIIGIIIAIILIISNRPQPPPISITWRNSLLGSGKVMQLHNDSEGSLSLSVSGSDDKDSSKVALTISGGATKELGILEMNWDWQSGETYTIQAAGYALPIIGKVP